jgi:hypothetical protein
VRGTEGSDGTRADEVRLFGGQDSSVWILRVHEGGLMIDNEVLRGGMQAKLDVLGLTGEDADRLVRELNFLSCMLIKATEEGRLNG